MISFLSANCVLSSGLLLGVGCKSLVQRGLWDSRCHSVRNQLGRNRSDGILCRRSGTEKSRGGRLGGENGRRIDLVDTGLRDGSVAGADFGRQDLLETGFLGNFFDALEVLWRC